MYHQQNLQIHGIYVPDSKEFTGEKGDRLFRFFELKFSVENSEIDPVPARLPIVSRDMTPYSFQSGELFLNGERLTFANASVHQVSLPPEESKWHLKGYTIPFQGTKNPYRELRVNPRITGYCPGKCFFCHRLHSHRLKPKEKKIPSPSKILDRIAETEGANVFNKFEQIILISELFGREDLFLLSVEETRSALAQRGFSASKTFDCCAQDVRSHEGHKRLLNLVNPVRYSFTLEFFRDRSRLMGRYKGLPMEQVYRILASAREAGFKEIRLNYMAGIDSLEECLDGFRKLSGLGLVDSVGLSTFTFFSEAQIACRHETAWNPVYYLHVVEILKSLGIKAYMPASFNMGCPYTVLMENTKP